MIQPLNQAPSAFQTQYRPGDVHRGSSGDFGGAGSPIGNQARETGLSPEHIIPGVTKSEEPGTKGIGKDGKKSGDSYECQTCENRRYKDGSDDPGVSFKTATRLSPEKAASAVRSHEREHVTREQAKAKRENREVVSQSVTYQTSVCPECGKPYVSGGTTTTMTRGRAVQTYEPDSLVEKGRYFDQTA